jgi:ATP-dependent Clp protease adaptor protein ClpS
MGTAVDSAVKRKTRLKEPGDYRVILLNDDYTSMEFVVHVLELIFHKNEAEANDIMLRIHKQGRGTAGIYTFDIAKTKSGQVIALAEQNDFPLQCIVERA